MISLVFMVYGLFLIGLSIVLYKITKDIDISLGFAVGGALFEAIAIIIAISDLIVIIAT